MKTSLESIKEYHRQWYYRNKERAKANHRAYYLANKEAIVSRSKAQYRANREKKAILQKIWRQNNKARIAGYREKWKRKNINTLKESAKVYGLKKNYGMTVTDWNIIAHAQNGLCAICRIKEAKAVDHCHNTGRIRGLLCFGCNAALGHFKDDIDILQGAIAYLEKSRQL